MNGHHILNRKKVYENFFVVEEIICKTPEASESFKRFVLSRPDSAAVLLHDKKNDAFVFVRQFRAPALDKDDPDLLEVPAGIVEANETPLECIQRETLEETGFHTEDFKFLYTFYPSPGISSERIHLFYAVINDDLNKEAGGGIDEENEFIRVEKVSREKAFNMICSGDIIDGKTIAAVQWLELKLRK